MLQNVLMICKYFFGTFIFNFTTVILKFASKLLMNNFAIKQKRIDNETDRSYSSTTFTSESRYYDTVDIGTSSRVPDFGYWLSYILVLLRFKDLA